MIQRRQFIGTLAACSVLGPAHLLAFGKRRRTAADGWTCQIIETPNHNLANRFPVVTDVSMQKSGKLLAVVGDDHYISIYDFIEKRFVQHLGRHTDWVRAAKFSNDDQLLATAGNDRQLFIWETGNWRAPMGRQTHPGAIFDIAFSPDGRMLATVGFDSKLRLFDPRQTQLIRTLECPCPDMHAVAFSNDNLLLAAGGRSGTIRVWNAQTGDVVGQFTAHQQRIRSIQFGANNMILSTGDDQIVKLTKPEAPWKSRSLPRHAAKLYAVQLLGGGLVATAGSDNNVHVWRISDATKLETLSGHTGTVTSLDWNRTHLVSGSYDTQVRVWTRKPEKTARRLEPAKPLVPPTKPAADNQFKSGWHAK